MLRGKCTLDENVGSEKKRRIAYAGSMEMLDQLGDDTDYKIASEIIAA